MNEMIMIGDLVGGRSILLEGTDPEFRWVKQEKQGKL
jgi:hypothetical protein